MDSRCDRPGGQAGKVEAPLSSTGFELRQRLAFGIHHLASAGPGARLAEGSDDPLGSSEGQRRKSPALLADRSEHKAVGIRSEASSERKGRSDAGRSSTDPWADWITERWNRTQRNGRQTLPEPPCMHSPPARR